MTDFAYVARTQAGEKVSGTVTATTQREAMAMLVGQSLFPMQVDAKTKEGGGANVRRVPARYLAAMYAQLADLLRSGVPLLRSIEVLQKHNPHAGLRLVLEDIHHQVEDGSTLAEAMGRFTRVFGEMPVSMVRAGGEGGFMEEVLTQVAQFTETQEDLKKRTMGAVAYPVFLMVVGTTVVTTLIVFFVPKFETMFAQLRARGQLPAATEWLLLLSHTLRDYGIYLALGLVVAGFLLRQQFKSESGRLLWDRLRIKLPLMGPIFLELAVARFCRVLGTLLRNGVPILRSLDISADATANRVLGAAIREATENISAGQPLATPLRECGHFPDAVVEMIAVAEQANNLENVLLGVANSMEVRTWRKLELAVRLLEPIMLLILAGVVLAVVIALLLPMIRMSSTLH
jgi:general secretion pathway protein F/type IV pilus assembly protein PilC